MTKKRTCFFMTFNRIASIILTPWDKNWMTSLLSLFFVLFSFRDWVWLVPENHFDWTHHQINIKKAPTNVVTLVIASRVVIPPSQSDPTNFSHTTHFFIMTNPLVMVTEITPPFINSITQRSLKLAYFSKKFILFLFHFMKCIFDWQM